MYLAIDIGGSKTLLAVFDDKGQVVNEHKFPTNHDYALFMQDLQQAVSQELTDYKLAACCCAVPGIVDRNKGIGLNFGNLPWKNAPIKNDLGKQLGGIPVIIENDSKLAGLSEALLVQDEYKKVLYLTVSTGIGGGLIINGVIDPVLADSEAGQMMLNHDGQMQKWEEFASGKALVRRFGKKASEIEDPAIWKIFVSDLSQGLDPLLATLQPELVIIGGGVGAHFDKFGELLKMKLDEIGNPMIKIPPIVQAKHAEEAVIYGCYDLIRQQGH